MNLIQKLENGLSPFLTLFLISVSLFFTYLEVDEYGSKVVSSVKSIKIRGFDNGGAKASSFSGKADIPLYGSEDNTSRELSSDINESIFSVVEEVKKPVVIKEQRPVVNKEVFDLAYVTKQQLELNGISFSSKAAYLNNRRFKVGYLIKEFPINTNNGVVYPKLVSVATDSAVVEVNGKHVKLELKESR